MKEKEKEKEKRKRKKATWTSPCATVHRHFCPKIMSNFSLHSGEKTFWWVGEKTHEFYNLFSFLSTQPNTLQKFSFIFSFQSFPSIPFHLQTKTPL